MVQAERIEEYLQSRLPRATGIAVENVQRLPGAAPRETWSFDARWREGGADVSRAFVIRRDPDASLLETDRDIEFRVMEAVGSQGVPVPRMYWLGPGTGWVGGPVFVVGRGGGCPGGSRTPFGGSGRSS